MGHYYNKNYKTHQVNTIRNIYQQKVWNVQYDDTYDYVYIMVAKINQLKGNTVTKTKYPRHNLQMSRDNDIDNYQDESFHEK